MSKLDIARVESVDDRNLPIFDEINEIAEEIRIRAYNLFANRGFNGGNDLEDWLLAEREICWPSAELVEEDDEFEIRVALAGFEPKDISVTATPRELIIKAAHREDRERNDDDDDVKVHWSEFRGAKVYRHIPLPSDINVKKVTAEFEHGMLEIEAPKAAKKRAPKSKDGKPRAVKITT